MKVLVSDTSVLLTSNAVPSSIPPSAFHSSLPSPTCCTNASSGSMAGQNSSGWGCASRNWMATESRSPSAISASANRSLFRTASPSPWPRQMHGLCCRETGDCVS